MKKLAIIDDYERVALGLADWSALDGDVEVSVFHNHLCGQGEIAARRADFEIVCMMRERTPFPRSLIEKQPKLKHLFTNGIAVTAWSTNLTEERCAEAGVAYAAKEAFYANADFISIHVHLGTRNKGLVGAAEIAMMKPTAYLINTARGPAIVEAALIAALRGGVFAGAGLDVLEVEPLQAGNPLLGMGNVVLTPH